MMHVLIESGVRSRPRGARWTLTSITAHAAIVTLALVATSEATTHGPAEPVAREPIFFAPVPDAPARPAASAGAPGGGISIPDRPVIPFSTNVTVPTLSFDGTRPVSADAPISLLGRGLDTDEGIAGGGIPSGLYTATSVDRAVVALSTNPRPDYPQSLRAANLEGEVLVTFVVDSTGHVEPGSVTIIQATHEQFAGAVRRWQPRTRYRPAEVRGVRVRQYVQQQVGFSLAGKP